MSWAIVAGAAVSVVGVGVSETGRRKSAKSAKRERRALLKFQLENLKRRSRIADKLEEVASKIFEGKPLSGQEEQLIASATEVATRGIGKARKEAVATALGEQAATGFLKGGRTARQLRRLNIEAGEAQQNVELAREQAIQQAVERNKRLGIQTFGLAGQLSAQESTQQFPQPISSQQVAGTALTTIGGAALQFGLQQQGIEAQRNFLQQQQLQQQATQGGVAAGSAGASAFGVGAASNIFKGG